MASVPNLEWSLSVPNVQELASQPIESVPHRYVRDDLAIDPCDPLMQIPLIDMAKLVAEESREDELQNLHVACKDWGAFQLINHGIYEEFIQKIKEQTKGFFNLPLQEKAIYKQRPGSLEGYGNAFVVSEDQKLEWCDMIFLKALPLHNRNLDMWPEQPQAFREALDNYSKEVRKVAVSLLGFMAMALGLEAQQLSQAFEEGICDVRMNYYPPCPQPELVVGVAPHNDISGVSLLLEGDNTPGLQIRKDGLWVSAKPVSGAIFVNIGDLVEIVSNGIYKSAEHRALTNREKERISVVAFCYSNENAEIAPLQDLIKPENPAIYEAVSLAEYFHRFYNRELGDRLTDSMKIKTLA